MAGAPVLQVRVETTVFPAVELTLPEVKAAAAVPGLLLSALKPKLTVIASGVTLGTIAPAGEPGPHQTTARIIAIGAAVALVVVVVSAIRRL